MWWRIQVALCPAAGKGLKGTTDNFRMSHTNLLTIYSSTMFVDFDYQAHKKVRVRFCSVAENERTQSNDWVELHSIELRICSDIVSVLFEKTRLVLDIALAIWQNCKAFSLPFTLRSKFIRVNASDFHWKNYTNTLNRIRKRLCDTHKKADLWFMSK